MQKLYNKDADSKEQPSKDVRPRETSRGVPSFQQMNIYLELLEQFQKLRHEQGGYNGNFGLFNPAADAKGQSTLDEKENYEEILKDKRWAVYVTRAVYRYTVWWDALKVKHGGEPLRIRDMAAEGSFEKKVSTPSTEQSRQGIRFEADDLPPLDILLIWSTHMLSPRAYLEDCLREGLLGMWFTGVPWLAIEASLKNEAREYRPGKSATQTFQSLTGLQWDSTEDHIDLTCPVCRNRGLLSTLHTPLTTCGEVLRESHGAEGLGLSQLYELLSEGRGYADPKFFLICGQCDTRINHNVTQIASFENDLKILKQHPRSKHRVETDSIAKAIPLRGSILDIDGRARNCSSARGLASDQRLFPNRLLASILASPNTANAGPWESMEEADESIRNAMMMPPIAIFCQNKPATRGRAPIYYHDCVAMDKTMTAYWNNPGPFSIELVRSAMRQGNFASELLSAISAQKADLSTMAASLSTKYIRFMQTIKKNEDTLIVPTLEVDLVWHTHQLSPKSYYEFSCAQTEKFVDHPHSTSSNDLSSAFKNTCQIFKKTYGEPYSTCSCGCGEVAKSENTFSKILSNSRGKRKQSVGDPADRLSHMSTHNSTESTQNVGGAESSPQSTSMIGLDFDKATRDAPQHIRYGARSGPWAARPARATYLSGFLLSGPAI